MWIVFRMRAARIRKFWPISHDFVHTAAATHCVGGVVTKCDFTEPAVGHEVIRLGTAVWILMRVRLD